MNIKDIPVHVVGPGSQPTGTGDELSFIDMPRGIDTFVAPTIPEPDEVAHMEGARETMTWLQSALARYDAMSTPQLANLGLLDGANRELVNQILGEGEVSVTYAGETPARVQESVLTGVWRTFYVDDDDSLQADILEVASVPHIAVAAQHDGEPVNTIADRDAHMAGPNALPILVEIAAARERYEAQGELHSINLTMLPMSDDELEFLDKRLGRGPVDILSRAYGKCQVISTASNGVWWVRYYNSMDTLILNTIEVCGVPQVVAAAPEDLADSSTRLREILAPYWPDGA
jgi:hydrogenase-1 operon protein HyaF